MTKEKNNHKYTTLAEAMAGIMSFMQEPYAAGKGNYGPYVPANELKTHIRTACAQHGVSFTQDVHILENGREMCRTTITHASGDSKDYFYPIMWQSPANQKTRMDWAFQGGLTYASRYALMLAFGIYGEKDREKIRPMESMLDTGSGEVLTPNSNEIHSSDYLKYEQETDKLLRTRSLQEYEKQLENFSKNVDHLQVGGNETAPLIKALQEHYGILNSKATQQPMEAAQ